MMNIIRADIYRIFRGKGIYITFAVMLLLVFFSVFIFNSMPQTGIIIASEAVEDVNEMILPEMPVMTGATAATLVFSSMEFMAYFFLPLIIIVAMAMFSTGAIKNELSTGLSRIKLYFSKFLLSFILCVVLMLSFVLLTILSATILNGVGYWGEGLLLDIIKMLGALTLLALAFNSVGMFLCFVTKRTAAVNGIYIALLFVPSIIVLMLSMAFPNILEILNYDLFNQFTVFSQAVLEPSAADITRSVAVCLAFILVPTIAGVSLFRKAEIK